MTILTIHRGKPEEELARAPSNYKPMHSFRLDKDKPYKQQFADMYFLRLTKIKPAVEQLAFEAWDGEVYQDTPVKQAERVLDIRQGELCWVVGTVYMDMPLKPNILDDVSKDVRIQLVAFLILTHLIFHRDGFQHLFRIRSTAQMMAQMPSCLKTNLAAYVLWEIC